MGFRLLLLMFAGVTLGGLGTAYGALVGSLDRRRVRPDVDPDHPQRREVRRRPAALDRHPRHPAPGHPGQPGADRLRPMIGPPRRVRQRRRQGVLRLPGDLLRPRSPSASTCTSATPGCSTSARSRFAHARRLRHRHRGEPVGPAVLGRRAHRRGRRRRAGAAARACRRCGCGPTTWRSSRSRRRRALRLLFRSVVGRRRSPAAPVGLSAFNGDLHRARPVGHPAAATTSSGTLLERRRAVGRPGRLDRSWLCFSLLVWQLMRSPWGRVRQGDPRGRGRRPGAGQERLRLQDAGAGARRCDRRPRRHGLRRRHRLGACPTSTRTPTRSWPTRALILGGAARVLGPVIGAMLLLVHPAVRRHRPRGALVANGVIPDDPAHPRPTSAQIRFVLVGIGLMLLMVFRPQGIFGDRREVMLDAR